jgi:hypothetical protein
MRATSECIRRFVAALQAAFEIAVETQAYGLG